MEDTGVPTTPSDSSPPPPTNASSPLPPEKLSLPPPEASLPPSSPSSPPPSKTQESSPLPSPMDDNSSPSPSPPAKTATPPPPVDTTPVTNSPSTQASPPPPPWVAPAANSSMHSPPTPVSDAAKSPALTGSSQSPPPPSTSSSALSNSGILIGGLLCGIFILAMIMVLVTCCSKKKRKRYNIDPPHPPKGEYYNWNNAPPKDYIVQLDQGHGPQPSWGSSLNNEFMSPGQSLPPPSPMNIGPNQSSFTYDQLAAATSGFSQANLLGQGGFGYVHKGVLPNGKEVAVKSLKSGSGQGEREFQAEVEIISRVHHRHLVSLVGYCIADGQRMLVYEFVPNKTLEFHLHGKGQPVMDWATRMRIALGASKGLAYLHEDCYPKIIHRDIKAANILLDNNFEAMVADFGLAKLSSDTNTHVSTRIMGTFGYLAPEYAASGKLTDKSDVFSFGVMLLELITGRKPVDRSSKHMEDSLVDWARPLVGWALVNGNYNGLVDPLLENNYNPDEMAFMVACAAACIRHSARRRPKMTQIVRALEGDSSLDDLIDGPKPVQNSITSSSGSSVETGLYDSGTYNADMKKFRKMVTANETMTSSEYGATSEYGLNPSSSSSDLSDYSGEQRHKI